MRWEFSDGTTVDLGGDVQGRSEFAQQLRREQQRGAFVYLRPHPCEPTPLEVDNATHVDLWLKRALDWARRGRKENITLTKRPEGIPPVPPFDYVHVPGRVY